MKCTSSEYSNRINRTSWKPKDLEIICAYLNSSDGGEILYNVKEKETFDTVQRIINLVNKKLKKIGPDTKGLIDVISGENDGQRFVKIIVKPSPLVCYVATRSGDKSYYYAKDHKRIRTSKEAISLLNFRK